MLQGALVESILEAYVIITLREQSDLATTAKLWQYNFSLIYLLIIASTTPLDLKRTFHFERR